MVAMPLQLMDELQAEDRRAGGMVEDVQADETEEKSACYIIGFRYRHPIMITQIRYEVNDQRTLSLPGM
jgi:hypothetical protein